MIPKIKLDKFTEFIKSKEVIATASAIIITPMVMAAVTSLIGRFPVLRDHFSLGLGVAAFVIFVLSSMVGNGLIRAIILGVSAGMVVTAITSTSFGKSLLDRLAQGVPAV